MNTRQKKKFRVSNGSVHIIEIIDGINNIENIYNTYCLKNGTISRKGFSTFFNCLLKSGLIIEKSQKHILSSSELKRFNRQINYFSEFLSSELAAEKAQKKLLNSVVAIWGCGAVGGNLAVQLAMAGVGTFILIDPDVVEESDCSRHVYFKQESVGDKKVESLADYIKSINPAIKTYISYQWLHPNADLSEILKKATFLIDAADEPYLGYTANLISQNCVPIKLPHYIAGGFDAHLASTGELIIPYITPCAGCYSTYFERVLSDWKPEHHPIKNREKEMGGLAAMSLFSSSFACIEIIKYICGLKDMKVAYKPRAEFLFNGMKLFNLTPSKDPNCKICGGADHEL
nr:ThiF family adenylyltransferase [Sporolactobacillus spathodeae]